MTSTPRLPNGKPPAEKMPTAKPRKASGKKPPKKIAAEAMIAKPVTVVPPAPAPAPVKSVAAPVKPPAPAMPPKTPMPPLPALDGAVESFERSFQAAGQGAMALNAKLIDMARTNVTSGFDFMTSLATAKHPADIALLQMSYWDGRMRALLGQAHELRTLSAEIVAKANEPIRAHIKRSFTAKAA